MGTVVAVFFCLFLSMSLLTLICARKRRQTMAKHVDHKFSPLPSPSSPFRPASLETSQTRVPTAHTSERTGIKRVLGAKKRDDKKTEFLKEESWIADKLQDDKGTLNVDIRKVKSNSDSDDVKKDRLVGHLEPHRISLNAKEKLIAGGAKRNKDDYPTMGDIISDWETKDETQKKQEQKVDDEERTGGGERSNFEQSSLMPCTNREIIKMKEQTKKKTSDPIEDEEKTQRKATEELKTRSIEGDKIKKTEQEGFATEEIKRLACELLGGGTEDTEILGGTGYRMRKQQRKRRPENEWERRRGEEEWRSKEEQERRRISDEFMDKRMEKRRKEREGLQMRREQQEKMWKLNENTRNDLEKKMTQKTQSREIAEERRDDTRVTKQTQQSVEGDFADVEKMPRNPLLERCSEMNKCVQNRSHGSGGLIEKRGSGEKCSKEIAESADVNLKRQSTQETQERTSNGFKQEIFQNGICSLEAVKEKEEHILLKEGEKNIRRSDEEVKKKK